ncbi:alcohol dehydrogenase catalytic domain-containing protein [Dactylosporangium vinaceum]|uniref:Zinc-binding dehydrogenase n=1 Tax=Dactylosporangium vinaceum TaxID=53362 RepID=A0ABV5MIE9_9ACTN|nr:alcohol dehydrogenase catalytic domain-containing protein [Dactylosporangium vinaceum]UAB97584.1 alcohol dehydrogenase catalytic domain-containing protein [Dactylosporangium vinaceum]
MTAADMLALVVRGPKEHAVERVPRPVPGPGEALVAITHVAMCGTDLRLLRGTLHDAEYPVIPGHEWAGRVVSAPTRPELVGRAVVADNILPCRECPQCAAGRFNLCTACDELGFTRPGAFAELVTIPAQQLEPLPEQLSGAAACLLEPLGVALHACERGPDVRGRLVGVIGGGTIGLLVAQLAAAAGAQRVSVVDPVTARRALATELGLDARVALSEWDDEQPEVVFDSTGVADVFPDGLRATRPGGAYVLVGYSGEEAVRFEPSTVMLRELTVYGVLSGQGQLRRALEVATSGAVRLEPLVSAPLPLSRYRAVLEDTGEAAPLRRFFEMGSGTDAPEIDADATVQEGGHS